MTESMSEELYPSVSSYLPPYKIRTIQLPSSLLGSSPTSIATLLSVALSNSITNPATLPSHAIPYPLDPSYEIRSTSTKGFGMFATRRINAGELILDEHPVLIVPECPLPYNSPAWDRLGHALPHKERTEMLTMANCRPSEECQSPVEGIVRTNALMLDLTSSGAKGKGKRQQARDDAGQTQRYGGVFLKINRCNHSCGPNAGHKWDVSTLSSKLYALRAIEPEEEITIFYTDVTQPRDIRRAELERNHRFQCTCPHCLPPTTTSSQPSSLETDACPNWMCESDDNRHQLRDWLSTYPSYLKWSTDLCRADDVVTSSHRLALALIDQENVHFLQHIFLEELALCYAILGDEDEFRFWAKQFVQKCGIEAPARAKEFEVWLMDPRKHKKWAWRPKQRDLARKRAPSPVYDYSGLLS